MRRKGSAATRISVTGREQALRYDFDCCAKNRKRILCAHENYVGHSARAMRASSTVPSHDWARGGVTCGT